MKHLILLVLLTISPLFSAGILDELIVEQTEIQLKLDDLNSTASNQEELLDLRLENYELFLSQLINEPDKSVASFTSRKPEIYKLRRKIEINTHQGNHFASLRDRIKADTYKVEMLLQEMLRDLLSATEETTKQQYSTTLEESLRANRSAVEAFDLKPYEEVASQTSNSKIVTDAKENLQALKTMIAIDHTLRKYILAYQESIHKMAVYSSFGFMSIAQYINSSAPAKKINPWLNKLNLDGAKLTLILIIIMGTIMVALLFYKTVNLVLEHWHYKIGQVELIINNIRYIFRTLIVFIGIDMITEVYTGLGADAAESNKFFSMGYILLGTFLVYRLANTFALIKIQEIHKRTEQYRSEVINLAIKAFNFLIFLIGTLLTLNLYGFDLTAILSGLGIGSLAVAFAAKDTLANFFGSISILLDNPFSQGDWIDVDGKEGTVIEIGLRSTTIRTFDNAMITIPNLNIANSSIVNWNKRLLGRRIKMHVGVTYESNMDDIKNAIKDIETMLHEHPQISGQKTEVEDQKKKGIKLLSKEDLKGVKKTLLVYLDNFSDSSIDILVYCFSKSVVWSEWLEIKQDILFKIAEILEKNDLSFAYPSLALHVNQSGDIKKSDLEST